MAFAFLNLSRMLHEHYETAPIIMIDEYDTPIQQGHIRGYYEKVIDFMRILFSGGLKDNPHLSYGFLTGILRVAKETMIPTSAAIAIQEAIYTMDMPALQKRLEAFLLQNHPFS